MAAAKTLLRSEQAADYLGLSTSTLAKMRLRGDGPPYTKIGRRLCAYDLEALNNWLDGRQRTSTSQIL